MRFWNTVSFRVFAGSLGLLLVAFALFATFTVRFVDRAMTRQALEGAQRVSDTIEHSTRYSMLLNRKEDVYQIIRTIGTEAGVEGIRIVNKRGEITFSTDPAERGHLVDLHAEACVACHAPAQPLEALPSQNRTRIFTGPNGHRVLGIINPIRNAPECTASGCHAGPEQRTVLGVLDVRMSLVPVDAAIGETRRRTFAGAAIGFAVVAVLAAGFLDVTVRRPIHALTEGTRQLAAGNLDHAIEVRSGDDLGSLATSFNQMTHSLREAQQENAAWAQTLEDRVRQKTEQLEQVHQQVLQIEKMASLGTLAATVAHEINNPLSGILTYAKLMMKRLKREDTPVDRGPMLQELDTIVRETQRCGGIVSNLLLFARRKSGEFRPVSVRESVERARQLVAHHLQMSGVSFASTIVPADLWLLGDEGAIEQALLALFVNAVEAMPEGGALQVAAERDAATGEVVVRVSDTGVGIAPEDQKHIFEPFFTTKHDGKGVGLGLSVVYGIVTRHGGRITVTSAPGRGTTFVQRYPAPSRAAGAASDPATPLRSAAAIAAANATESAAPPPGAVSRPPAPPGAAGDPSERG